MLTKIFLYLYKNDNYVELLGLTDVAAGTFVNNATVAVTLKDKASGASITGDTWPLAMSYVTGSNGDYRAILKDSLSVTPDQQLTAEISADAGADRQGFWELSVVVKRRTE